MTAVDDDREVVDRSGCGTDRDARALRGLRARDRVTAALRRFSEDPAAGFRPAADLTVIRTPLWPDTNVREALAAQPEVAGVASDTWLPFRFPDGEEQLQIRLISDPDDFAVVVIDGVDVEVTVVGSMVTGVALAAAMLPERRAARIPVAEALRHE